MAGYESSSSSSSTKATSSSSYLRSDMSMASNASSYDGEMTKTIATTAAAVDEAWDRIATMCLQEESDDYRCVDYLAASAADSDCSEYQGGNGRSKSSNNPIDVECRTKMHQWSSQVVGFCKFDQETVSVSTALLDRFMSASVTRRDAAATAARTSRREYQLAAMTALYVAVKLREPLEMDTALVSELSRGCYSAAEVADAERKILDALLWRTSGPTPMEFYRHFLALLPTRVAGEAEEADLLLEMGRRQAELAAGMYDLTTVRPSTVAIAALLNALDRSVLLSSARSAAFLRDVRDAVSAASPDGGDGDGNDVVDFASEEVLWVRAKLSEAAFGRLDDGAQTSQDEEARRGEEGDGLAREDDVKEVREDARQEEAKNEATRRGSVQRSPVCVSKR